MLGYGDVDDLEGSPMAQMDEEWNDYMAKFSASQSKNNASGDGGPDVGETWITWFCRLRGNEFFCQVDDRFIKDDFNRFELSSQVPNYRNALSMILDESSGIVDPEEPIKKAAKRLYGLLHARYILTQEGLDAMLNKFKDFEFERCPRFYCSGQACLPVGLSDFPEKNTVKIYCPKCKDIYCPQNEYGARLDGAYFGTTFPHMFLMTYEDLKPQKATESYVPRLFGFKVTPS